MFEISAVKTIRISRRVFSDLPDVSSQQTNQVDWPPDTSIRCALIQPVLHQEWRQPHRQRRRASQRGPARSWLLAARQIMLVEMQDAPARPIVSVMKARHSSVANMPACSATRRVGISIVSCRHKRVFSNRPRFWYFWMIASSAEGL